ncbi:MAG: phytanoyl-CoA dioxygenase family protein [Sphingomonadales bacterium]|nr:phytanoyl-CoA dioxygenase family protein [Sphingomonadales bacterium]
MIDLGTRCDGMVKPYLQQVAEGQREDSEWARLRYLARANYAHLYVNRLRRHSNEAGYLKCAGLIERRLLQPWYRPPARSERAEKYETLDYYIERRVIPLDHVAGLRADLFAQQVYYDPYADLEFRGRPEQTGHPLLYMDSQALFANPHFLSICANPEIIAFCREVLGPGAALSWAWSWITNPVPGDNYQTQNWHRDCAEPLNFVRVFVPLHDIVGLEDGPTALIPGSSHETGYRQVRRFSDDDLAELLARRGAGMIQADAGDVYFVNTMALHRGVAPTRQRAILTLLVSLSPSHRTPGIVKLKPSQLPEPVREVVRENRRFFRYLVH